MRIPAQPLWRIAVQVDRDREVQQVESATGRALCSRHAAQLEDAGFLIFRDAEDVGCVGCHEERVSAAPFN